MEFSDVWNSKQNLFKSHRGDLRYSSRHFDELNLNWNELSELFFFLDTKIGAVQLHFHQILFGLRLLFCDFCVSCRLHETLRDLSEHAAVVTVG